MYTGPVGVRLDVCGFAAPVAARIAAVNADVLSATPVGSAPNAVTSYQGRPPLTATFPVTVPPARGSASASAAVARVTSVVIAVVFALIAVALVLSAASARVVSVATAAVAAPAASNADDAWVAAVPSPRLVRAVAADARSDRLLAFCAASASAASARLVSVATAAVPPAVTALSVYAVVASCVLQVNGAAVGAVGVPVNAGDARPATGPVTPCTPLDEPRWVCGSVKSRADTPCTTEAPSAWAGALVPSSPRTLFAYVYGPVPVAACVTVTTSWEAVPQSSSRVNG